VGKAGATILGLAVLAGVAIYVGKSYLSPAGEQAERDESVLTGALDPRIDSVELLEDSDLPEGVDAPMVGDLTRYVRVTIFYPDRPQAPAGEDHKLTRVNVGEFDSDPVHTAASIDEDGARVIVVYRVGAAFDWGRIERDGTVIAERFELN
jgi:hypothetical protein